MGAVAKFKPGKGQPFQPVSKFDLGFSASRSGSDSQSGYQVKDIVNGPMQASYELDMWGKIPPGSTPGMIAPKPGLMHGAESACHLNLKLR